MIEFTLTRMDLFVLFLLWFAYSFFSAFFVAFKDNRRDRKALERLLSERDQREH